MRPGRVLVMVRGLGVLGLVAGCVMVRVMGVMGVRVGLRAMVVSVIATLSPGRGRGRSRPGHVLVMVRVMGVMGIRVGLRVMVVSVIATLSMASRCAGMQSMASRGTGVQSIHTVPRSRLVILHVERLMVLRRMRRRGMRWMVRKLVGRITPRGMRVATMPVALEVRGIPRQKFLMTSPRISRRRMMVPGLMRTAESFMVTMVSRWFTTVAMGVFITRVTRRVPTVALRMVDGNSRTLMTVNMRVICMQVATRT